MIVLFVYGVPNDFGQEELEIFADLMKSAVAGISELEVKEDQVVIFFPGDRLIKGLGEEIVILVAGLTKKFETTKGLAAQLAMNLVDEACQSFPKTKFIKCIIQPDLGSAFGKF